ncbi:hypothetical protein NST77_06745 [Niallia sp. FSL W8-0177]|uniref:hypothetical protein n=1 Tax=Niallia sp. FSL W8-0177 TaxID=2954522 RepID=UPI0030FB05A0
MNFLWENRNLVRKSAKAAGKSAKLKNISQSSGKISQSNQISAKPHTKKRICFPFRRI